MKQSDVDKTRLPWLKMSKPERAFYPLDPRAEDVDITNIAWALSMQCRFNGHIKHFYSVAQHSVMVSRIVESEHPFDDRLIFRALMHDAHEAYVGDIVTPIKRELERFHEIEEAVDRAICDKYNMDYKMDPCIKKADVISLMTEVRDLMTTPFLDERFNHIVPLDATIIPLGPQEAYDDFLQRFEILTGRMDWNEWNQEEKIKETA